MKERIHINLRIGYSPHSKACRLWDNISGRVFDSFHVTSVGGLSSYVSLLGQQYTEI